MKLVFGLVLLSLALASDAVAGVGVWTPLPNASGGAIVVGPDGALYEGCSTFYVCKSVDGGFTWQMFSGPGPSLALGSTNVAAVDSSGTIYAAFIGGAEGTTFSALSVSSDGGTIWTGVLDQLGTDFLSLSIDPSSTQTLFVLTGVSNSPVLSDGRVQRSIDGGSHWTYVDPPTIEAAGSSVTAIALDPRTQGRLYAAALFFENLGAPPTPELFASGDDGSTWARSAANLPDTFTTLVVDPFHPATIYGAGSTGIFRSDDGGQTFASKSAVAATQIVTDALHAGRVYAATPANGVLTSSDAGTTWTAFNDGLASRSVYSIALDPANGYLYATTGSGVFVLQLASPTCQPDAHTLCLNNGRFSVTAEFQRTPEGTSSPATAVPLTSDTGYFWFFDPNNVEVVTKVLNGCSTNGHYWFFASGLTNVGVQISVTDTLTGTSKPYSNAVGSAFQPIQDTAAFPCP